MPRKSTRCHSVNQQHFLTWMSETVFGEILQAKHILFTYYTLRALTLQNYATWCHEKR